MVLLLINYGTVLLVCDLSLRRLCSCMLTVLPCRIISGHAEVIRRSVILFPTQIYCIMVQDEKVISI